MGENDLPLSAIVDNRTFSDEAALHGLLARLRRTDPSPFVDVEGYPPFWLAASSNCLSAIV